MQSVREMLEGEKMTIIAQLNQDLAALRHILDSILRRFGQRSLCPRCGDGIVYLRRWDGPLVEPYNRDGTQHSHTCTKSFTHEVDHER